MAIRFLCLCLVMLSLYGCTALGFYAQSVTGHMSLMMERDEIARILGDESRPDNLKQKLQLVLEIREFASDGLGLPRNDSYSTYVDTKQRFVVWNVLAAPEFSLELKEWCFLFAGCIKYRGYFSEQDAHEYSVELSKQGLEVYVGGAIAYSTLGWFDDPVLNTFVNYPDANLAGLIFHELAHQQLYVKNDSAFNEGFATLVEMEGVKRWLAANSRVGGDDLALQKYQTLKQRKKTFVAMINATNDKLRSLYGSTASEEEKRQQKSNIILQLREQYQLTKKQWDNYTGYDAWFGSDINNAQLASVATYQDYVPAFQQLLIENRGDLNQFFDAAKALGKLDIDTRNQQLQRLRATFDAAVL